MAESPNEKQQIGTALSVTRTELNTPFLLVRQNLVIRRYLLESQKTYMELDDRGGNYLLDSF